MKAPRRPQPSGVTQDAPERAHPVFNRLRVVQKLVKARPRVLIDCKDSVGETPFQARLSSISETETPHNEVQRHELLENDSILRYMRAYIIVRFDRREAMKALYKIGQERALEFDLSGLPYSTINADFLKGLRKVLRFQGLLKYVALPRLSVQDDETLGFVEPVSGKAQETGVRQGNQEAMGKTMKGKGLQHMCSIFQWLKKQHVKSILKVTVIDNEEPSHSDEAIEACMSGLDVRVWNWYKMDLCCSVIIKCAPRVRDVTLYSSGRNAVLVGWSSPAGLPRLVQLETVQIYVEEGLESRSRLEENLGTFEDELKKLKPNVQFSWKLHRPDPNFNSVFIERGPEQSIESKWMNSMKAFAEFLRNAKPDPPVEPIKIAIIDDGINTALDDFTDRIQVGESFYQLSGLSGRRGAYYVPSGPHGTLMAQSICEVCPVVKLYIAQLEVLSGRDGRRSFTPESATEAIDWAIMQGVDIISMSWSINTSTILRELENALQRAANARIIMFCASIDEGATAIDNTYPGKEGNCIKIGACTGTGAKLSWVSESNSNFLVPGEAPQTVSEPSLRSQQPHMPIGSVGSSVSTALAAGLAGVLLYCDRLLESHTDEAKESMGPRNIDRSSIVTSPLPSSLRTDDLRNLNRMKEAFATLSKGTELNKFPQVWDYLPEGPLVWDTRSDPDATQETRSKLEELMRRVKHW